MNRKDRRAERSARGRLKALEGGKQLPPDTPPQRLAADLKAFLADYVKKHGGLDSGNVMKVVLQVGASLSMDHGAPRNEFVEAMGLLWDEEEKARAERRPKY